MLINYFGVANYSLLKDLGKSLLFREKCIISVELEFVKGWRFIWSEKKPEYLNFEFGVRIYIQCTFERRRPGTQNFQHNFMKQAGFLWDFLLSYFQ